ncbi:MAG: type IX secretion system protein PorQ, partial [Bacteroidota bacterium]
MATLAQLGGNSTYRFLSLPASARSAALGGAHISTRDSDLALVYDNPALLDSNMRKHFSLTYINYLADINFGYAAYAREIGNWGTFGFGLQFLNYGRFTEADFTGVQTGEFSAGEYSLNITYAYEFDSLFAVGGTFKTIYSSLTGEYQSFGNALDLGATYRSKNKRFSAALVVKNLGIQLKPYVSGNRESLPLEIQAGISRKMKHAPFRVSILARNLQKWDLTFDNPFQQDSDDEEEDDPFNFGEEDG